MPNVTKPTLLDRLETLERAIRFLAPISDRLLEIAERLIALEARIDAMTANTTPTEIARQSNE